MKGTYILSACVALFFLVIAHADVNRFGVKDKGQHEHMFISAEGAKEWYSALELEGIARRYAETKKVDFQFEGAEMNIWVKTDGGKILADVWWSHAIGKPSLHVEIGRDGKPTRYETIVLRG